ncbi:hypothetical protein ACFYNF_39935 [Streptomyces sp. NPDC006641]|uniref:hypothetical protein n=1 Tax=unclassified Streptomyces TaxID=2593676 RepID=UPI00369523C3
MLTRQWHPALKLLIALVGVHALYPHQARALPLNAIDFTRGRLTLGDLDHPLDAFTQQAAVDYIHLRHQRWPHTLNPHLFISSQTAHTRAPVTTGWMQPLLRGLPVTAQQLRENRILEEAAVTGADPQHLCAVFNITPETGLRYTRFFHPDPTDSDDMYGPHSDVTQRLHEPRFTRDASRATWAREDRVMQGRGQTFTRSYVPVPSCLPLEYWRINSPSA